MTYTISALGYLQRAEARLAERRKESLFYAALELRCCIEARQDEYMEAQRRYAESIPKSWEIGKQWKLLSKIYNEHQIQRTEIEFTKHDIVQLHYVPVPTWLCKETKKLGELLHAPQSRHTDDDPWWDATRERLVAIYREAWTCCRGELLSPALVEKAGVVGRMAIDLDRVDREIMVSLAQAGVQFRLNVEYLEDVPDRLVCGTEF